MAEERAPLDAEIRRRIARDGPMSISAFMTLCLYDPEHGYYPNRDPLGAAGDFVTAPEISQMFGELIGLWAVEVWREMGSPDPIQLIELGPGRGTMMLDVLRAARAVADFRRAARVHLIEVSPALQQRQGETLRGVQDVPVRWHKTLGEAPLGPAIILANEFFDALPDQPGREAADRVARAAHHRQCRGRVRLHASRRSRWKASRPTCRRRSSRRRSARSSSGVPINGRPSSPSGWSAAAPRLVIDYGHARSSTGDTFQAVRSHRFASPLGMPGRTDLTAHVDFAAMARAARAAGARIHGPVEQGELLKRLGIEARARALQAAAPEDKRAGIAEAMMRLVGTGQANMGTLFKAMAISAPRSADLPGFAA